MSTVSNPILPGCYPDPSICRVGDDYYLVTSTFEYLPGLPVLHSRDLVSWEQIGHVVDRPGQLDFTGIASSGGLYAPTIRYHDGQFWVVCTLVDQRDGSRGGNFLMTAKDPAGPWSDPIWLESFGIDPSIFFDDDGRIWVHGTRLALEPRWHDQTEVWVRELDRETMQWVGPETVIWHGAVEGVVWSEAPHIYKVDGTYYLIAAEGGTEFHHAESVARSDSVTGPYVGTRGNPVLTHRHLGRRHPVVGAGHADLVEAADGSWWAVLLAMRTYGGYHYPLGRETFLVPVVWEDGWPVFAPGVGKIPDEVEVPFAGTPTPGVVQGAASGVVPPADLRWTAVRAQPSEVATPAGEGWDLPLRPATLADLEVPAFLGLRLQHRDADLTARVRADLGQGEEVGLVVRQSEKDHARLAVTADGDVRHVRVVHRQGGQERVLGEVTLAASADAPLVLGVRARGADLQLLAGVGDTAPVVVATADATQLDTVATGGFLGLWLGVYGTSAGAPTQTVAHVERVEYAPAG
ncbi:family 43 glycosylhydrolase [Cellulomonas sp. zg-ZUI222]|uniref:Family 43 glycosylhydrolase n=1 Tax=Cellulomonas wangleii TaxID=2816956 RepID=A0ABX8D390_9CELL|nr:glycoside hydrolase family 43 protein [Cellulomonas wangleii]MBO0920068.1 family 43 glycosylhydrolase [Cellulomonas wangleii]MBO0923503.1 family 43 glycosylhydrolase [Cellulomonas wangleii]QVI61844.1 family 43 glycosylhydrolase [Cellulomonas wangleii]